MNIVEILSEQARLRGDAPALVDFSRGRKRRMSFVELDEATARAAAFFQDSGLRRGDTVLVFIPMSLDLYITLLGILRAGMTSAFLDPSAGRALIEHCCTRYPVHGLVGVPRAHWLRVVSAAIRRVPVRITTGAFPPFTRRWSHWVRHDPIDVTECRSDTPALVTFTSGSTGVPKIAVRTHRFLLAQHRVLRKELAYSAEDRVCTTLPIFVLSHLGDGTATVIPAADLRRPGSIDPGPVVAQLADDRVTGLEAAPAFLERIVEHCLASKQTLPAVRKIFTGGAPVFPALLDQLQSVAPNATVTALYGSTEAEPIAHIARDRIEPDDITRMMAGRGLLAGPPVSAISLRVMRNRWGTPVEDVDASTFDTMCLGQAQGGKRDGDRAFGARDESHAGEIVVSGEHVLSGYHEGIGDEETKFRVDGRVWHRTGDAGYLDAAGRLWLLGRCSARIHDDRGELYPFAVECAAYDDVNVRRSACISHNGKRLLLVELVSGAAPSATCDLAQRLAWASIDRVVACERIPMDRRHNSKVDYPALERMLRSEVKVNKTY